MSDLVDKQRTNTRGAGLLPNSFPEVPKRLLEHSPDQVCLCDWDGVVGAAVSLRRGRDWLTPWQAVLYVLAMENQSGLPLSWQPVYDEKKDLAVDSVGRRTFWRLFELTPQGLLTPVLPF